MTLVQQFPDISEARRIKSQMRVSSNRLNNITQPAGYIEDKAVVEYFRGEFRKWHLTFVFIVASTIAITLSILLKNSWIYNLIGV